MATTQVVTRPNRVLDVTLAVALAVVGITAFLVAGAPKAPAATTRTTTATRGVVLSTVQASGNVQAGQVYSVNFQTGGTVQSINVAVGQLVTKGQVLARLDPTLAAATLGSAQASLKSAQAQLAQTEQVLTPAQRAQAAGQANSGQQQVIAAQANLGGAQQTAQIDATQLQSAINTAQAKLNADQAAHANAAQLAQDQNSLSQAQNAVAAGENKDQLALTQAQNQLNSAEVALSSTLNTNAASAELLPSNLAQAQASVSQSQSQFTSALLTMSYTTLVAPNDGVVSAINGVVGQTVSGGGTTAASSTTTAGSGSSTGGGGGGGGGGSTGSASSSGSGGGSSTPFMTITDLNDLTVKAGFAETDATKLAVGQPAVVTFSALPNVQAAARVIEVDANSTLVSNVVTYNATVALTNEPAGVKPGMTASVTVTVGRREGVVAVPSAAVRGSGSSGTVTVVTGKQQATRVVGIGLRGATLTEITSGLAPGDTVVLPSNTLSGVSSQVSSNAGRFLTGGLGGLGGGGAGGGRGGGGGGARAGG